MSESIKQPEARVLNAKLILQTLSPPEVITGDDYTPNIKDGDTYKVAAIVWNVRGEISYLFLRDELANSIYIPGECLRNKSLSIS